MYKLELEGFPSLQISDTMVLPFELHEVLRTPWGIRIDADDFHKQGGEIGRWLLERTPLKNNRRYTNVYVQLQYLRPGYLAAHSTQWHVDGSRVPFLANDIFHTMICQGPELGTNLRTQFLKDAVTINVDDSVNVDQMDHKKFRDWFDREAQERNLEHQEVEPGRIYTWTSRHPHRVLEPKDTHFRFFWKVAESDHLQPLPVDQAFKPYSTHVDKDGVEQFSIEQGPRGIIFRGMKF